MVHVDRRKVRLDKSLSISTYAYGTSRQVHDTSGYSYVYMDSSLSGFKTRLDEFKILSSSTWNQVRLDGPKICLDAFFSYSDRSKSRLLETKISLKISIPVKGLVRHILVMSIFIQKKVYMYLTFVRMSCGTFCWHLDTSTHIQMSRQAQKYLERLKKCPTNRRYVFVRTSM